MKFAFYTVSFSPHQLPLAKVLMDIFGEDEYRYVSVKPVSEERKRLGWCEDIQAKWYVEEWSKKIEAQKILESVDVLMTGVRNLTLIEERCGKGLLTIYCSERWFKPRMGILRLLKPSYFKFARRFVRLLSECRSLYYFPMGIHAARDMARLCGLMHMDLRCLFKAPNLSFERKPGGRIFLKECGDGRKYCLGKMRMWGYYVEPSRYNEHSFQGSSELNSHKIRILWVGRLLKWKCVDTIVRTVGEHVNLERVDNSLPKMTLDIYGTGPEEKRLKEFAAKFGDRIKFYPSVSIDKVRTLMHEHDVYVLSSNAYEGWGAVVSEAIEERMRVIGTYEAGSSATVLPDCCLFHAGDCSQLRERLESKLPNVHDGLWSVKSAAKYIKKILQNENITGNLVVG